MSGQLPAHTAWDGGVLPKLVKRPPGKRPRPPQRPLNNPNFKLKFIPPKDLAKTMPIPRNPLLRPQSRIKHGVRVEYGNLFPYNVAKILRAAQHLTKNSGYVDVKPYNVYFEFGYFTEKDADIAANLEVIYKNTCIPVTRTREPSQTTLTIHISNLPTNLHPELLKKELLEGLASYGQNPVIVFDVPHSLTYLTGPQATAVICLDPQNLDSKGKATSCFIPFTATLSSAP